MPSIFSTLTADQSYTVYTKGGVDLPVVGRSVLIKGGSNVADKMGQTKIGVLTTVTAEDLADLERCPAFVRHKARGFIVVASGKGDPEKVAADMATKDGSAPMTPEDRPATVGKVK